MPGLLYLERDRSYEIGQAHGCLLKAAADEPVTAPILSGRLFLSRSGWLLLSVPNGLVRGLFDTLDDEGLELPPGHQGQPYNAHISVMRREEVEAIGGGDVITERGKAFHYQLGPLKSVMPKSWDEMSRVWFVEVQSPELRNLRKSYGLSGLPRKGDTEMQFHITVAVRRKKILQENEVAKAAELQAAFRPQKTQYDPLCPHCGEVMYEKHWVPDREKQGYARHRGDCYDKGPFKIVWPDQEERDASTAATLKSWGLTEEKEATDSHYLQALSTTPLQLQPGGFTQNIVNHLTRVKQRGDRSINEAYGARRLMASLGPPGTMQQQFLQTLRGQDPVVSHPLDQVLQRGIFKLSSADLDLLAEAKDRSDLGAYGGKHALIRQHMDKNPQAWKVDSVGRVWGVTHVPTGYRFHVPPAIVPVPLRPQA